MGFSLKQALVLVVDMETFNKIEFLCPVKQHETPRLWRVATTKSTYGPDVSTLLDVCEIFHAFANPHKNIRLNMEELLRLFFHSAFICVRARGTYTQSDDFFLLSFPTSPPPTVKTTVVYIQ